MGVPSLALGLSASGKRDSSASPGTSLSIPSLTLPLRGKVHHPGVFSRKDLGCLAPTPSFSCEPKKCEFCLVIDTVLCSPISRCLSPDPCHRRETLGIQTGSCPNCTYWSTGIGHLGGCHLLALTGFSVHFKSMWGRDSFWLTLEPHNCMGFSPGT